jgi:hypothetical protein
MIELPFRVEILATSDEHVEALIANAATFPVAHAAFVAAVRQYPTKIVNRRSNLTPRIASPEDVTFARRI